MAFLVKISSWGWGALMKRCAFSRAPSYASVASAASLYALRLIGVYAVSMNRVMASMTTRGFWLLLAESRYTMGRPSTSTSSRGKSLRIRDTSKDGAHRNAS